VPQRKARNGWTVTRESEGELNQGGTRPPSDRDRGDAGAGLIGLMFSVLVFLIFLLFATQLLIGLYARSVVAGAAFDGAQYVARHPQDDGRGALTTVQNEVGATLVTTRVTRDADYVEYTVVVSAPRFLSKTWLPDSADTIERTARARIERPR
jgi:Flp pilus assembly protein TadG